jgi:hypothetical protein
MFDSALIAGGIQQEAAYSKYLSKINDLNSAENIDSINLINWNN